ncbi:hypothetical protein MLD38_038602 [Melastoma candidum]|uniref:Uncharacterized protein n=1 Tax=Melastoma candidum TaxID=119954 RepID=A0ACB9L0P4_9MYRT|nr:hypothetical protein MLD38_038602 [Melastoma candidum]
MGSALLAIEIGLMGPNHLMSMACASSNYSFYTTTDHIRKGNVDIMVAGGSEAVFIPCGVGGFIAYRAVSPEQRMDEGYQTIGQGSIKQIMESLEATKRGANIIAGYLGGSISSEAHHITEPHPDGLGISHCTENSLEDARFSPEEANVNYINAHSTLIQAGDLAELNAIHIFVQGHL